LRDALVLQVMANRFSVFRNVGSSVLFLMGGLLVLFGLVAWLLTNWVRHDAVAQEVREGQQQLQLYAAYVRGELVGFENIPALLATNQRAQKVLQQPENYSARQALNEYLEHSAKTTGALDIYLMNAEGVTVAASNWQSDNTFIGRNFSYRPYFQQAMQGTLGRYYALGSTSRVRGYYFAYPVIVLGKVSGVMVLKMDVASLESQWHQEQGALLVSDPDGIVFISTNEVWRYRSMWQLSEKEIHRIALSARYPGVEHVPLEITSQAFYGSGKTVKSAESLMRGNFLHLQHQMPELGWMIHLFKPLGQVQRRVVGAWLMMVFAFVVAGLILAVALQRRWRREESARADATSRLALERAHGELEQRVEERTADLQREVEERTRAEQALRTAQDELVQATKLATLGQMSASINHELNQPLTAIRSYADNARLLLERERYDDVRGNMQQISDLVDRMAQISSQLKLFARKSSGQRVPVSLRNELDVALKILDVDIRKAGVRIVIELCDEQINVLADATRLEQVLVNLIGNAVHALTDTKGPRVNVSACQRDGRLRIDVQDNGPGIPEAHLEQIFDPFFTTRKTGLGLGLAISQLIVENMGGSIGAANLDGGGAVFTLTLDLAEEE